MSEWMTRSPIELSWTAKNIWLGRKSLLTRLLVIKECQSESKILKNSLTRLLSRDSSPLLHSSITITIAITALLWNSETTCMLVSISHSFSKLLFHSKVMNKNEMSHKDQIQPKEKEKVTNMCRIFHPKPWVDHFEWFVCPLPTVDGGGCSGGGGPLQEVLPSHPTCSTRAG